MNQNPMRSFDVVIVVGGTGLTGHWIINHLLSMKKDLRIVATSREVAFGLPDGPLAFTVKSQVEEQLSQVKWLPLDLAHKDAKVSDQIKNIFAELKPQEKAALVMAAAFTNVEACEIDQEYCTLVNETNTIKVFEEARQREIFSVFMSTDYVFDGEKGPYKEDDQMIPLSVYGRAKANVEKYLKESMQDSLIVRTTGAYDYLAGSKNFLMQVFENAALKKNMKIPADQYSNPVWANELAKAMVELILRKETGVFHIAGGQWLSRLDFTKAIVESFSLGNAFFTGVLTGELLQKAKRPLKGGLNCDKLKKTLGWKPIEPRAVFEQLQPLIKK